ncbi:NUDIX hydrolase [Pediococcus cellicola]|uniref:Mutt nudix family protein n=1 Tax=Pediococcus cellicola TaxID=319652 RepID=A0A0R2INS4_9LACO|nr:NUDIX hydrolase [Pediococcus cellicola]KRN66639.1 mutt nudix family protein [Pediococcus cellicola]GEL14720.1 phosphohydrolase [Pediococcus cellicola]
MTKKYHRAFGVYGVITHKNKLVVIKKNGGPYINRYDLPGGSLEDGESLEKAIGREIEEETGLQVIKLNQLGTTSFKYPWHYEKWLYNQHICVFYRVNEWQGTTVAYASQFVGQDSLGAKWLSLDQLNSSNASPLVLKAKAYLENDEQFDVSDQVFRDWKVLQSQVFDKK